MQLTLTIKFYQYHTCSINIIGFSNDNIVGGWLDMKFHQKQKYEIKYEFLFLFKNMQQTDQFTLDNQKYYFVATEDNVKMFI